MSAVARIALVADGMAIDQEVWKSARKRDPRPRPIGEPPVGPANTLITGWLGEDILVPDWELYMGDLGDTRIHLSGWLAPIAVAAPPRFRRLTAI